MLQSVVNWSLYLYNHAQSWACLLLDYTSRPEKRSTSGSVFALRKWLTNTMQRQPYSLFLANSKLCWRRVCEWREWWCWWEEKHAYLVRQIHAAYIVNYSAKMSRHVMSRLQFLSAYGWHLSCRCVVLARNSAYMQVLN